MAFEMPRASVPLELMNVGPLYVPVVESVVRPFWTARSELASVPMICPVTVMPWAPPQSRSTVPFLLSAPERVSNPVPEFWIVSVPLPNAKTFFDSVPEPPV